MSLLLRPDKRIKLLIIFFAWFLGQVGVISGNSRSNGVITKNLLWPIVQYIVEELDVFTNIENRFDRLVYQNDRFFWFLALFHFMIYLASWRAWIPVGSMGALCTVLSLFSVSWVYTNARRRACSRIKAGLFGVPTFFFPAVGGVIYLIFRPKELVVTSLPPSKPGVWPVFAGPVWIFARAPFRFLFKLALWLMGLAFLLIGFLDIFGKV